MWVYFTRAHDTAASIAQRFARAGNVVSADTIYHTNINSSAHLLMGGGYYAPERAVVIPTPDELSDPFRTAFHQRVLSELDSLLPDERGGLARLIRGGHNINTLAHAARMSVKADKILAKPKDERSWWQVAKEWFDDVIDFESRGVDKFLDDVKGYKSALDDLKQAVEHNGDIEAARAKAKMIYQDMLRHFHTEVQEYKLLDERSYFDNIKTLGKEMAHEFIPVVDEEKLANLMNIGRALRFISGKLFWLNIGMDIFETYEAYEHHGPWIKMAIADALEVGAAIGITAIIGLVVVDTGGLAAIGAASVDATFNYYLDKRIHKLVGLDA